jgi:FkbM family methyltransferase
MTFTSYADNFEDVILRRALRGVECGFYIDIGAQDPVIHSVSLAFYESGWRGVHVEPVASYAKALRLARPDEDVIAGAVGVAAEAITFFEISDTGLSTGDRAIAERHVASGAVLHPVSVHCIPLAKILDRYATRTIHWLKIDVEGMERAVVESWPPSQVRPWIVLIESTKPHTQEPSFADWEPQLLALGYEFVYFDGLNRFYVSVEHPELKSSFGPGPNVFDDFRLSSAASDNALKTRVQALELELAEVYRSFAWRTTAPLRRIERAILRLARTFTHRTRRES